MRSTMPSSPLASGKNLFISLLRRTFILSRTWQKSVRSSTVRLGVFSITSGEPLTTKGTPHRRRLHRHGVVHPVGREIRRGAWHPFFGLEVRELRLPIVPLGVQFTRQVEQRAV